MIWKDNIMKYDYKASAVNRRQKKKTDVSPFFLAFYGFFVFNSHPLPLPDLSLCFTQSTTSQCAQGTPGEESNSRESSRAT